MRTAVLCIVILLSAAVIGSAQTGVNEQKRIDNAANVLRDMTNIPQDVWQRANCVIVIPSVKKAAFVVGGEYGKGVATCRTTAANRTSASARPGAQGWTAPAFFELEKGSWGLQIGAQEIDLVLLVMNQTGIEHLLSNKFTLGADGSVAAGPVGRSAAAGTDVQLHAEILSYSRSQGLFAGIDLSGGVLKPDTDANTDAYGANVAPRDILLSNRVTAPAVARAFLNAVARADRAEGQPAGGIK